MCGYSMEYEQMASVVLRLAGYGFLRPKINVCSRLLAVGDLAHLNVGSRGHLSFKDGRVK